MGQNLHHTSPVTCTRVGEWDPTGFIRSVPESPASPQHRDLLFTSDLGILRLGKEGAHVSTAPGSRTFIFQFWGDFDKAATSSLLNHKKETLLEAPCPIAHSYTSRNEMNETTPLRTVLGKGTIAPRAATFPP